MNKTKLALALLLALLCVGCSGKVKLGGTVSFTDGTPVDSGMVYFVSKDGSFSARGEIQNGEFQVSSVGKNDGLPKGEYNVYFSGIETVVKEQQELENGDFIEAETRPAIDVKYMSASTSGITQNVDGSTKKVEFQLERLE